MLFPGGDLPEPERVLIIKPSALGDVVTAMPVLRGLKRTFPDAQVSWLISDRCAPLVSHDSNLDGVVIFDRRRLGRAWRSPPAAAALAKFMLDIRRGRFDWVIDLQGLIRSGLFAAVSRAPVRAGFADAREGAWIFYTHRNRPECSHTVDRNIALARMLGIDARAEDMSLELSPGAKAFAESPCRTSGLKAGGFLVAVPPTTWPTKLYPVRHWRTVVESLCRSVPVVLAGAPSDRTLCEQIAEGLAPGAVNLAGQTKVDEFVGLIAASAGVICSDSAAKFIASAVGVDSVTLIGPTRPERTGPYLRGRAIVADVPCQGCLRKRCRHITCMQSINPAEVISAAQDMLSGHPS